MAAIARPPVPIVQSRGTVHTDDPRGEGFEHAFRQSLQEPATVPAGDCVDTETLAAWSDGALAPMQASSVELHLSTCASCQAMLAAFVRTTPVQAAAVPFWRRWQLQWLVPLATATATLTIWLAIPGRTPAEFESAREDRPLAQPTAPSAPPVSADARDQSARFTAPRAGATLPGGAPPVSAGADKPPAQARAAATADALAKSAPAKQKKEAEADERVATLAAEAPAPRVAALPRTVEPEPRARADLEERKAVDASRNVAVTPPAAAPIPAAPPASPPAAAGTAAAATPPAAAPAPGRQEQFGGALAQSRALSVSSIEVTSPTSGTRWRIAAGGAIDYFGKSAPTGRPTDIPASAPITAGSSPQDDVCWMVGRSGAVYLTTNGTRFTRIAFPDAVDLVVVRATDANTATVTSATGLTYRTTDAGKSWQQQ
jgi:hypothetical protein